MNTRFRTIFASGALLAILAGCASTPTMPEEVVRTRATQRWAALLGGSFDKAYALLTPSYRASNDLDTYKKTFGASARWLRADVVSVHCEPQKCIATVEIAAQPIFPVAFKGTITTQVEETWILENGQWWLLRNA